jgi:MOSC domain-containing protein YiiM
VIEVVVATDGPDAARSLAACVAAILEMDAADVPAPGAGDAPLHVGWWLQGRGLGLVPVADAATFSWPGHWIGLLRETGTAVVMFGSPSGVLWDPLGRAAPDAPPAAGWVIAPLTQSVHVHQTRKKGQTPFSRGRVEAVLVAGAKEGAMRAVERVEAVAGEGLEGDRYAARGGTFSANGAPGSGHEVTLVDAAALEAAGVTAAEARRNIVTTGIDLDALIGERFTVGGAELAGRRRCEPCAHLQRLTRPEVLRALVHRGGLRADVLGSGTVAVGDAIVLVDQPAAVPADRQG